MSTYSEEAAAELRKARDTNDKLFEIAAEKASAKLPFLDLLREASARSVEIADGFIRLAAIGAGLPAASPEETP